MNTDLKRRTVVITGASKGIGLSAAETFADAGAAVVVGSRSMTDELEALTERASVTHVPVDLATPSGAEELVAAITATVGGIDVLVNNLGASEPASSMLDFTDDQWDRMFATTFFSAVRTVRAAVPAMRGREGASIVNVSSLNAKLPAAMMAPYCAAKAALTNFGKALSEELAPQGIRVNTVSPGPVRTPMWTSPGGFAEVFGEASGSTVAEVMDRVLPDSMAIATGRVSEADEVADLVLFLASRRAGNITGSDFVIDGGMHKSVA